MSHLPDSMLDAMRRRRAAGERVSALAKELRIPWQRLEKLTRLGRQRLPIPDDPRQLKRELRWTRLMLAAVPDLGCSKRWAVEWRERIASRLRGRINRLLRRLKAVTPPTQVAERPARPWKPRPATPADARIARMYDQKATPSMWGDQ